MAAPPTRPIGSPTGWLSGRGWLCALACLSVGIVAGLMAHRWLKPLGALKADGDPIASRKVLIAEVRDAAFVEVALVRPHSWERRAAPLPPSSGSGVPGHALAAVLEAEMAPESGPLSAKVPHWRDAFHARAAADEMQMRYVGPAGRRRVASTFGYTVHVDEYAIGRLSEAGRRNLIGLACAAHFQRLRCILQTCDRIVFEDHRGSQANQGKVVGEIVAPDTIKAVTESLPLGGESIMLGISDYLAVEGDFFVAFHGPKGVVRIVFTPYAWCTRGEGVFDDVAIKLPSGWLERTRRLTGVTIRPIRGVF